MKDTVGNMNSEAGEAHLTKINTLITFNRISYSFQIPNKGG